jgi:diguanylate cyclase (GGDEF)-like protein
MQTKAAEKKLKRLIAITRIHQSIGTNLQVKEIARILVRELIGIVDCDGCAFLLIKDNRTTILAERGFSKTFCKVKLDTNIHAIEHIVRTKEAISTGDIVNSTFASCLPTGCSMQSLLCIPIIVNDEVHGIIHFNSLKKNAFDEEDILLTRLLAKEVAIAIERAILFSEIWDISIRDGLTESFNRRKFDVDLVAEIASAQQHQKALSLMMVDIDWFKKYNDFHGHQKGDALLKKVTNTLIYNVRPSDRVYRWGGDEFTVLLPTTTREKASLVAKRLQQTIELEEFDGETESQPGGKLTISIGVATFPTDANQQDELVQAADSALYKAKNSGRNMVFLYSDVK